MAANPNYNTGNSYNTSNGNYGSMNGSTLSGPPKPKPREQRSSMQQLNTITSYNGARPTTTTTTTTNLNGHSNNFGSSTGGEWRGPPPPTSRANGPVGLSTNGSLNLGTMNFLMSQASLRNLSGKNVEDMTEVELLQMMNQVDFDSNEYSSMTNEQQSEFESLMRNLREGGGGGGLLTADTMGKDEMQRMMQSINKGKGSMDDSTGSTGNINGYDDPPNPQLSASIRNIDVAPPLYQSTHNGKGGKKNSLVYDVPLTVSSTAGGPTSSTPTSASSNYNGGYVSGSGNSFVGSPVATTPNNNFGSLRSERGGGSSGLGSGSNSVGGGGGSGMVSNMSSGGGSGGSGAAASGSSGPSTSSALALGTPGRTTNMDFPIAGGGLGGTGSSFRGLHVWEVGVRPQLSQCTFSSWLEKLGGAKKNKWQKRWAEIDILHSGNKDDPVSQMLHLQYKVSLMDKKPKGVINLKRCEVIKLGADGPSGRRNCLQLTPSNGDKQKSYVLQLANSSLANDWYDRICASSRYNEDIHE